MLALSCLRSYHTGSGFASLSTGKATGHKFLCYHFLTALEVMKLYGEVSTDSVFMECCQGILVH